jgi:nicotinamide-nucleotide amidase
MHHYCLGKNRGMTGNPQLLSQELGEILLAKGWVVATTESCTGGGVAAAITMVPGSSAWFEYGFVTYANAAKQTLLGVQNRTLMEYGAVSEAVVREMVRGALRVAGADIAVAVSGIAGPGGGSSEKPVGSVWFAWGTSGDLVTELQCFAGERLDVQAQAVSHALAGLIKLAKK